MTGPQGIGIKGLHHIAIAVRNLEEASGRYQAEMGLHLSHTEEIPARGVKIAYFPLGGTRLELIEPVNPDTGIARFLSKRGEGIHHLAYAVEDLDRSLDLCRGRGMALIDEKPRLGGEGNLVAFLHPRSTGGVLTELVEQKSS